MSVFPPLITELRRLMRHWTTQPIQAAGLVCLLVAVVVSGPLSCFEHCAATGETHHSYHADDGLYGHDPYAPSLTADDYHHILVVNERGDHALCDHLIGLLSSDLLPSALTVAIVPALNLVPQVFAVALQRLDRALLLRLVALPPPREPPRISNSFSI